MTIESIVRPFVVNGVTPPDQLPLTAAGSSNIVVLRFGRIGRVKMFRCNSNGSVSSYMDNRHKEMGNVIGGGGFGPFG